MQLINNTNTTTTNVSASFLNEMNEELETALNATDTNSPLDLLRFQHDMNIFAETKELYLRERNAMIAEFNDLCFGPNSIQQI